jgi:23S rRNA pseudouridine1911/1915/1917 synthase
MEKSARDNASVQPKGRKGPRRLARRGGLTRKPPDRLIVPQEAELFHVYPDQAGMRLDQFLKKRLHWRSRTKVQELIAGREITAGLPAGRHGGVRLDCSYRVKLGEEIRLPLPPPPEAAYRIAEIPLEVLYEDDLLIILNKPPDLVVHPAGRHRYDTLINALHLRYRNLHDPKKDIIPRLAHRIDRETSGVLIAYKMRRHDRASPLVFERTNVIKEYLTIAEGVVKQDSGVIDLPIGRQPDTPHDQAQVTVHPGGQPSRTGYQVLERFRGFTLLRCRLFTGRMHQIRVHLQAIGHPVVCDKKYGLRAELRRSDLGPLPPGEQDRVLLNRQALHAHQISFNHPITGKAFVVQAPLPSDMEQALLALRKTTFT